MLVCAYDHCRLRQVQAVVCWCHLPAPPDRISFSSDEDEVAGFDAAAAVVVAAAAAFRSMMKTMCLMVETLVCAFCCDNVYCHWLSKLQNQALKFLLLWFGWLVES